MSGTAATDVRRHILEVAHTLMLCKGFTAVGLTEVLAAARVPKGSFYHYFGSKEAFGEAVLEAYFERYLARMEALLGAPGPAARRLVSFFRDWLESQIGDGPQNGCLVVKLGAEVCDLSEPMRAALQRGTRAMIERLARCVEAGAVDGSLPELPELPELPDAQAVAAELYQGWLGATLLAKITRDRAPLDTAMQRLQVRLGLAHDA